MFMIHRPDEEEAEPFDINPTSPADPNRTKMMTVRLSAATLSAVNEAARRSGVSQNQWGLALILRALNERSARQKPSPK